MIADRVSQVEDAALNAWPSLRQMQVDGWLLRFTGGDSKRVNSVNVRYPGQLPDAQKIAFCEAVYKAQGLPVIFRLPDPFTSPQLIATMIAAGYTLFDPTKVLGWVLGQRPALPPGASLQALSLPGFIELRSQLSGVPLAEWQIYRKILSLVVPEKVLLGLYVDGEPAACGMGVVEGGLLGIFSIYTPSSRRRCGFGSGIMAAVSRWGLEQGATFGYLQVEGDNAPALAMYEKLGFELLYHYTYARK